MKVLITGSNGMLGVALCEVLGRDSSIKVTGLDLTRRPKGIVAPASYVSSDITDFKKLSVAITGVKPDVIIHTAAFTDVDGCEKDADKAETVNALGARNVAQAALDVGGALVHISTDFVFDGRRMRPYTEQDVPNPLSVYGRSKLDAEKFVSELFKDKEHFIVRTGWLYGPGGKNFVDTVLSKANESKELKIVTDQFGSPTYTIDLAEAISGMLRAFGGDKNIFGIYHVTNSDDCSWYKFAQKSLRLASKYNCELIPIITQELDRPAERPKMSILDNSRYREFAGRPLRHWERALEDYIIRRGTNV